VNSSLSGADCMVLPLLSETPGMRMRSYELDRAADWEKSLIHHQLIRMRHRAWPA
jgi:hypothetical protein